MLRCRVQMECWAALSYCKRDIERGPINPRQPRQQDQFAVLEYRQELRSCALNQLFQYQCVEQQSELCFEVNDNNIKRLAELLLI